MTARVLAKVFAKTNDQLAGKRKEMKIDGEIVISRRTRLRHTSNDQKRIGTLMNEGSNGGERKTRYKTAELPSSAKAQEWVTLVSCGTMLEADFLRSRLESEGVAIFIPDENLMTAAAWGLNAYGYIRVQVKPADYETARAFLCECGDAVAV
jgi:hypothetical protein